MGNGWNQANRGVRQAKGLDSWVMKRHDVLLRILTTGIDEDLPVSRIKPYDENKDFEYVFGLQNMAKSACLVMDEKQRNAKLQALLNVPTHDIEVYCFAVEKFIDVAVRVEADVDDPELVVEELTKAILKSTLLIKSIYPSAFDRALWGFLDVASVDVKKRRSYHTGPTSIKRSKVTEFRDDGIDVTRCGSTSPGNMMMAKTESIEDQGDDSDDDLFCSQDDQINQATVPIDSEHVATMVEVPTEGFHGNLTEPTESRGKP